MGLTGVGRPLDKIYTLPWLAALLVGWAITPSMMFVIGWILESRTLPIGTVQSMAFWPGDWCLGIALGLAVYGLRYLPIHGWWQSTWWPWTVLAIALVYVVSRRLLDAPNYTEALGATANSPTKLYHDIVACGGYFTVIVVIVVPVLGCMSLTSLGANVLRLALVVFLALYICGAVYDATHPQVEPPSVDGRRPDIMHPADWRPIWKNSCEKRSP
jgi:hypothetical protein